MRRVQRNRRLGARVRKSRQKEAAVRRTRALCKLNGATRSLVVGGVGTEAEEGAGEGVETSIDGGKRCDRGREVGIESGAGRRGRSAVNRAEFSSCGRAVSCRSSDPQWWRTELDLSSGKSFDDLHGSATVGAAPKRVRFPGGGFRFDLRWNGTQCCEA